MKGFRRERAAEQIRRELTEIIEGELIDDRIPPAYVSRVELAPDYSAARVLLLPENADDAEDEESFLRPYRHAAGFVRTSLAHRLRLRKTPEIDFRLDKGSMNVSRIDELLNRVQKRSKRGPEIAIFLILLFGAGLCKAQGAELERYEASATVMGTTFRIALYGERRGPLASATIAAFDEARRIDQMLSNYREDSELSRVNREAADHPVQVSPEFAGLLAKCLEYSRLSDGAFDVTVGRLMEVWGFFKGSGRLPGAFAVRQALAQVGYQHVVVDERANTVRFHRDGIRLDPGGIGKGYAVDRIANLLTSYGIKSAMISAGTSSMYGIGAPPAEPRGWRVNVRDPGDSEKTAAELFLKDQSLSTSGSYEKFFEAEGRTYSHIMDPRIGMPAQGTASVSIRAASSLDSEAWTTALFVNGKQWATDHSPKEPEIFFCTDGGGCEWLERR